jgi:formate hydrogenlyase transcriptional activator
MDASNELSEQRFRDVIETIPGLVAIMSPQGAVEFVSRRVLDYFGKSQEELQDWSKTDAVHPEDLPRILALWRISLESGAPYEAEHRLRRADGVYRWFVSRGLPFLGGNGAILRWCNLLTDIDDRKQSEEKLRQREADLIEAQRLSRTGSMRHNIRTGELHVSPEVYRMRGLPPGDGLSTIDRMYAGIHPEDRGRVKETYEAAQRNKVDFEAEYRVVRQDGSIRHLHTISHPIVDHSGEVVEYMATGMDITERWEAKDKLEKAFEEIRRLKDRLLDENLALREEIDQAFMFEEIVGSAPAIRNVISSATKVAPTDSTVLITGETGTGKELIARAIHKRSRRSDQAFISVNCASIPPALIGSELFGHEKGAFTGAMQQRRGRFELAHGGTLFLDEIGEIPAETQVALLRALQEGQIERVGGERTIPVDVRVIAATNRDLRSAIDQGSFRSDLYYRLNVFPIPMPPLRDRKEDIPLLIEYFVKRFSEKMGKHIRKIEKRTLERCQAYSWPGNIRELQNIVERSVILCSGESLSIEESWIVAQDSRSSPASRSLSRAVQDQEKEMIEAALAECRGKVAGENGAAAKLGLPASTLESKIKQLRIKKRAFTKPS